MSFDYIINNNKAYMECNVLVYNISVQKIPRNVTYAEATEYFSQFGDIKKLYFLYDSKESTGGTKEGFVHFSDPIAAANVLLKTDHLLQSEPVFVKACDRWNQPDAKYKERYDDTDYENTSHNTRPTLLQLNDDCLEYIFRLLNLRDQVHFGSACQRLQGILQMACKLEYKEFNCDQLENMLLWEMRLFFELAGPDIITIQDVRDSSTYTYPEFGNYCPNVKTVSFQSGTANSSCLHRCLEQMKSPTELILKYCSLTDNDILVITELPHLEKIMLQGNRQLTSQHLDKLINVTNLDISVCGIRTSNFISICKSLKKLNSLDICECLQLKKTALSAMVMHCHKLEILKMTTIDTRVARLPKLKQLEILLEHNILLSEKLFVALVEHAPQLEYLTIDSDNWITYDIVVLLTRLTKLKQLDCSENESLNDRCLRKLAELKNLEELDIGDCQSITNRGLLFLITQCTKLKYVNVQYCKQITETFIPETIKVLNQRQEHLGEQLRLSIVVSSINGSFKSVATTPNLKLIISVDDD